MSGFAPLAAGVVGGVVGFLVGGPIGAAIGFSAGAMLGGALFPPTTNGPKLSDLHIQGSSYGAPIPITWGTVRLAGNVIWKTDLSPHEHSSGGGGKGGIGGGGQKTTSYSASFDVCICESHGDHRLGRVWDRGQLAADYRLGATEVGSLPLVFYDGSRTQFPDPTEEGIIGAGLVPAYRGLARVVLTDMDLSANDGNALPQFSFEILQGTIADCPVNSIYNGAMSGHSTYPKITGWTDPSVEPGVGEVSTLTNIVVWQHTGDVGGFHWGYVYFSGPPFVVGMTTMPTWVGIGLDISGGAGSRDYDFALGAGSEPFVATTPGGGACADQASADIHQWTDRATNRRSYVMSMTGSLPLDKLLGGSTPFFTCITPPPQGTNVGRESGIPSGRYVHATCGSTDAKRIIVFSNSNGDPYTSNNTDEWWEIIEGAVSRHGTCNPPLSGYQDFGFTAHTQPGYAYASCSQMENNGNYVWAAHLLLTAHYGITCYKIDANNNMAQLCNYLNFSYSPGAAVPAIHCFEGNDIGKCGIVFDDHWEVFARFDTTKTAFTTLGQIAADICELDGVPQYDVSDIDDIIVRGYMLNSIPTTGRAALESILPVYFVDAVESDDFVKFVKRGKASLVTIPDDDLSAHADGEALPDKLQIVHGQDADLPSHLIFNFIDPDADYLIGTQQWRRMIGGSKVTTTANVPVVLTNSEAKAIVDAWGQNAWLERDQYVWYTTRKYVQHEPTDVVTVQGIDLRIIAKTEGANGVIKWEGRRARVGVFAQAGVAPGGGASSGTITPAQTTDLLMLDIPYPTAGHDQAYYAAMAGSDRRSWKGAELFKSADGGSTYASIAVDTEAGDTFGVAATVLGDFTEGCVFDEVNLVTVMLSPGAGELSSFSRDTVLAGTATYYQLGDEIVCPKNADLIAAGIYTLSGFLRGCFGTEWAMATHAANERFVSLPVATVLDALTQEYGAVRLYKTVTGGSPVSTGGGGPTGGGGSGSGGPSGAPPPPGALTFPLTWANGTLITGSVDDTVVLIFPFTTGSVDSPPNALAGILAAEFSAPPADRFAVISTQPGSFDGIIDPTTGSAYAGASSEGNTVDIHFVVGGTPELNPNYGYYPRLAKSTKYYFNLKQSTPLGGTTELIISLSSIP